MNQDNYKKKEVEKERLASELLLSMMLGVLLIRTVLLTVWIRDNYGSDVLAWGSMWAKQSQKNDLSGEINERVSCEEDKV